MADELILGRYRPIGEAGRGGFGTVVVAWDTRIKRRVAVKTMPVDTSSGEMAEIPGLEEARTAAMLSDACIVGVLDFEVQDDTAYLIMEYVEGITLARLLSECDNLVTADMVATVLADVSHALEVAHDNAVLHLDVKPDNILIDHRGRIKVTDFGLAELSSAVGFSDASGGTIGYMPLEQMARESLDERCDEWALASVIYEMIAGENPFLAHDLAGARKAIDKAEMVLPSLCLEGVGEEADNALFQALDPDKDERFEDVRVFAENLQHGLGDVRVGREELAAAVLQVMDDTGEASVVSQKLVQRARSIDLEMDQFLLRIIGAVSCGIMVWIAVPQIAWIPAGSTPWEALAAFAVGILAALLPPAGMPVVLALLATAFASQGVYVATVALVGLGGFWFWRVGRFGLTEAAAIPCSVLAALAGIPAAVPIISGYLLNVRDAVLSTICAWLVLFLLGSYSFPSAVYWVLRPVFAVASDPIAVLVMGLARPTTWIVLVAWVAASALIAVLCRRRKRVRAVLGMAASALVLCAACAISVALEQAGAVWTPDAIEIARIVIPIAGGMALAAWKVPPRAEYVDPDEVWDPEVEEA
ncbi:protein kinase family protein [Cryptobacterium curtum DSM 15641]|uniref:Protein kinase family protein n=1 Tax=Cryptobacterium curtum (strain ATCC 700683 / DSM 15641 / CCUG 43107 / 12-3) TaxID=469378 RepID=C7MMC8_CRYCD|nr:bifunctional serine/threonine protein kinase/MFS transporter [Cryptobacterium curtum]ACU94068.1 protein kinase family protein [Cryptobacterium curtum DSM 15641]